MAGKHVIIIGAGLGGICAAIKLQEAGHSFTMVEKLDKVGGTWAQNTYPGVACDVPVALYQYSFALSVNWSRAYPQGGEIQAYAEEIVDRYQLRPNVHLGDEAVSAVWDEDARTWTVTTASGASFTGDAVIGALGQLNRPNWPAIPGKDAFKGAITHTASHSQVRGLQQGVHPGFRQGFGHARGLFGGFQRQAWITRHSMFSQRPGVKAPQRRQTSIGRGRFCIGMARQKPGFYIARVDLTQGRGGMIEMTNRQTALRGLALRRAFQPLRKGRQVAPISRQRIGGQTIFKPHRIDKSIDIRLRR